MELYPEQALDHILCMGEFLPMPLLKSARRNMR